MKRLWLAGGLFAAVILLCTAALMYQQNRVNGLLQQLTAVDDAYDDNALEQAHALALDLCDSYDRSTALFPCFMSHADLVGCRESVVLLPSILKDGNAEEFHMESARCRAQLERLITAELPTIQNIL